MQEHESQLGGMCSRALQHLSEGVWIGDSSGCISYVNGAFSTLTGYPSGEALGHAWSMLQVGGREKGREGTCKRVFSLVGVCVGFAVGVCEGIAACPAPWGGGSLLHRSYSVGCGDRQDGQRQEGQRLTLAALGECSM
jgi:hypothetical protein